MTLDEFLSRSRVLRRLRAGPFRDCIDLYFDRFRADGYSKHYAVRSISLLGHFAGWLTAQGVACNEINEQLVKEYLDWRIGRRFVAEGDPSAMRRLIAVLRAAGIVPPAVPTVLDPIEQLLESFRRYLEHRRGLSPTSADAYVNFNRPFLRDLSIGGTADLASLSQNDVIGYVERYARACSPATARTMCCRLRSFLRYLLVEGYVGGDLAACVPSIKRWSLVELPTFLSPAQLRQVFQSCDRSTAVGRRDYAVLMMLARLGLRAKEVATLTLDDIDWRNSQFHIRGKGRKRATMPLSSDVGAALVDYLRNGRPASDSRRVFLRSCPPYVGFPTASGIIGIASNALKRAGVNGIAHYGSHVFRHSLATGLLRSGASLTEIGQVLRHQQQDTTRIYAKVDLASLRLLALPWPGAAQ